MHGRHRRQPGLPRLQEDRVPQRPRLQRAEPRPGRAPGQPGDRRRVRRLFVVATADGRPELPAELARKPLSRRHSPRLRAGDVGLPASGRGRRTHRADRRWRDFLSPLRIGLLLHRSVRPRAGQRHLLDRFLQRFRGAGTGVAGDQRERRARGARSGTAVGADGDRVPGASEAAARRPPRYAADHADAVGSIGAADRPRRRTRRRGRRRRVRRRARAGSGRAPPPPVAAAPAPPRGRRRRRRRGRGR